MTQPIFKLLLMFHFKTRYSKKKQSVLSSPNSSFMNRKDGNKYQGRKSNECNMDST